MSPLAIFLVVFASIIHATRDFIAKKSGDKQLFIWWFSLVSITISFPVVIYLIITQGWPNQTGILIAFTASLVHTFYWYCYSKAYDHGELSHVYPIMRSAPAFVLVFALIFLHEQVSLWGFIGITLVTIGVYFINLKKVAFKNLLQPLWAIRSEKAVQFAFLTLIAVTTYSLIDKVGVSYVHPIIYAFTIAASATILFGIYLTQTKTRKNFIGTWQNNKKDILINGLIAAINYPLILWAMNLSKVSYVSGLRQISIIVAVFLGGHFLSEQNRLIRLSASLLIFAGAILIAIA